MVIWSVRCIASFRECIKNIREVTRFKEHVKPWGRAGVFLVALLAVGLAPLMSPRLALAIDSTPPLTTPSPLMGTYRDSQNVTLTCSDGSGSGCAATYFCLGGGCDPATPYSGPISIPSSTTLRFYSTDVAGNGEAVRDYAYTIDPDLAYRFERLMPRPPSPAGSRR